MLFPILQALWQQFGPQAAQYVNSPAFPKFVRDLQRNAPHLLRIGYLATNNVSDWVGSLSPEEKKRLQDAGVWFIKDVSGDAAAALTGLPIGPLVDIVVENVFDNLGHNQNVSNQEYAFLQRYLKP
jgi:hypothetical protein